MRKRIKCAGVTSTISFSPSMGICRLLANSFVMSTLTIVTLQHRTTVLAYVISLQTDVTPSRFTEYLLTSLDILDSVTRSSQMILVAMGTMLGLLNRVDEVDGNLCLRSVPPLDAAALSRMVTSLSTVASTTVRRKSPNYQ